MAEDAGAGGSESLFDDSGEGKSEEGKKPDLPIEDGEEGKQEEGEPGKVAKDEPGSSQKQIDGAPVEGEEGEKEPLDLPFVLGEEFDIEKVPDKFKDEDGKIDVEKFLKSYEELEKQFHEGRAPEEYEISDVEIEGKKILSADEYKEDPMYVGFSSMAKELGLSQEAHDKLAHEFIKLNINNFMANMELERERLGDQADAVIKKNKDFYQNNLSEDGFATMKSLAISAEAVHLFNEIRTKVLKAPIPGDEGDVGESLTLEELRGMMRDPRYHDQSQRDAAFVKQVDEGFKKLFPEKQKGG